MKNDIHVGDDVIISGKIVYVYNFNGEKCYYADLPSGSRIDITEKDIKSYRPEVKVDGEDHRKGN